MRFKSTLSLISILLPLMIIAAAPPRVVAQVDEKEKAEKELAKRQELEKKTLGLLDETIGAAWSLKLPENRSYVLTKAADLMWPHDEKRARGLFWEALNSLNLPGNQALDGPTPKNPPATDSAKPSPPKTPTKEQAEALNQYYATLQTRREFLRKVAWRDPQLALDMLHASRPPLPRQIAGSFLPVDEIDLEQEITYAAAANDPKRALQIAHESMAKGLTYQILSLLEQVLQKDEEAGSQLAGEIIAKLNTENFNTNAAPYIAMQLLQLSRTGGAVLRTSVSPDFSFRRLKLDDDKKQELVNMLTDAALSISKPPNILLDIRFAMPEIERYAPDRVAKLKAQMAEFDRTLPQTQREWNNFNARFENATPEEMIKAANKVGDDLRATLFNQAAAKAVARGEGIAIAS